MKFLVDANLSPNVASLLSVAGHDAIAVRDLDLQDAPDEAILGQALVEDRVIVSHDTDFGTLLAARGQSKPSFVLVRSADPLTAEQVAGLIIDNLDVMADDLTAGAIATSLADTCAHAGCRCRNRRYRTRRLGAVPVVRGHPVGGHTGRSG